MIVYYLLFGGIFFTALVDLIRPFNRDSKRKLFIFWCIVFVLFKGLRWDTGTDWSQFYTCFVESSWTNIFSYWRYGVGTSKMEFGYVFLNVLVKTIFPHYSFFLIITNAFILYCFGRCLLKYMDRWALVGLAILVVSSEMFPVRHTLVTAIFFMSIPYIRTGALKKFLAMVLVAFSFHHSAILLVPFYWVLRSEYRYKRNMLIYLFVILTPNVFYDIFAVLQNTFLNTLLGGGLTRYNAVQELFLDEFDKTENNFFSYLFPICQLSFFSYVLSRYRRDCQSDVAESMNFFLNMYFVYLCLNSVAAHPGFDSLYRIGNMFLSGYAFVVGYSVYFLKQMKFPVATILVFGMLFVIKFNALPINRDTYGIYVPYKSFLQQDDALRSRAWPFHQ